MLIVRTLAPDHKAVKCLVAFGKNTLKYAAEILATIEWGTQHRKLQEPFPVPPVPRWLHLPEMIQTMMPMRGELPLIPLGAHLEDIRVCSPASVGVDSCSIAVLAGPYDPASIQGTLLTGQ